MNEENKEKKQLTDREKDRDLTGRAFRFPKRGLLEQEIAQHMFQSTYAHEPSVAITHICRAGMLLGEEISKEADVERLDVELLGHIFDINNSFMNVVSRKIDDFGTKMYKIPWSFPLTEENYEKLIKPWRQNLSISFYSKYIRDHSRRGYEIYHKPYTSHCNYVFTVIPYKEDIDKTIKSVYDKYKTCPECDEKLSHSYHTSVKHSKTTMLWPHPEHTWFLEQTGVLSHSGYKRLETAFEGWAIRICEKARKKISKHISPETYSDVMKMFLGYEKEERKDA